MTYIPDSANFKSEVIEMQGSGDNSRKGGYLKPGMTTWVDVGTMQVVGYKLHSGGRQLAQYADREIRILAGCESDSHSGIIENHNEFVNGLRFIAAANLSEYALRAITNETHK